MSQSVPTQSNLCSTPETTLLMLTRDAARTYPSCDYKLGVSKFRVTKRLQRLFPDLNIKQIIRRCGGKSSLKEAFNEERSRFAA